MAYNKTNWQNLPNRDTPIVANNLNKMEEGIYQNSLKADQIGDLSNLETTNKSTIVGAINEIDEKKDNYSTTEEVLTNKTVNDKSVYRAFLSFDHSTANSTYTYTHNLNIDLIINVSGVCTVAGQTVSSHGYRPMPMVNNSNGYEFMIDRIQQDTITTSSIGWNNNHAYIWIEYTKAD